MKTKSCLSYFGSDSEVAGRLAAMLNHCSHVTIPFVGGASIVPLLTARSIVANDLNGLVINFYRTLSGVYGEREQADLIARCHNTLSHPSEIKEAELLVAMSSSPVERAWAYWAMCWIGRKGRGGTSNVGGSPSVRWTANGGSNASRIRAAASDLEEWAKSLRRCEWTQMDFREVLAKVADSEQCGLYIDAPWFGAGGNYACSFSEDDHVALAAALERFRRTTIVVRYDNSDIARDLYPVGGWVWQHVRTRNQAGNKIGEVWISRGVPDEVAA